MEKEFLPPEEALHPLAPPADLSLVLAQTPPDETRRMFRALFCHPSFLSPERTEEFLLHPMLIKGVVDKKTVSWGVAYTMSRTGLAMMLGSVLPMDQTRINASVIAMGRFGFDLEDALSLRLSVESVAFDKRGALEDKLLNLIRKSSHPHALLAAKSWWKQDQIEKSLSALVIADSVWGSKSSALPVLDWDVGQYAFCSPPASIPFLHRDRASSVVQDLIKNNPGALARFAKKQKPMMSYWVKERVSVMKKSAYRSNLTISDITSAIPNYEKDLLTVWSVLGKKDKRKFMDFFAKNQQLVPDEISAQITRDKIKSKVSAIAKTKPSAPPRSKM